MSKMPFSKVLQACKNGEKVPFHIESEDKKVSLDGFLSYDSRHYDLLKLSGILSGYICLTCDRSGEEYEQKLEESLCFYLSNGILNLDNEHFDDVFECMADTIDFYEILNSELEMIRCDYHIKE